MREIHLRRIFECLADKVAEAANARRTVIELAGVLSRVLDELSHVLRRHGRVDRHRVGHGGDLADEAEVLERVVAQIGAHDRVHYVRRDGGDAEGVTVGRGIGDRLGADRAAGAAAVVDDERLPKLASHALGGDAADDVGRAAGRERDDQRDGLRRIRLRERR